MDLHGYAGDKGPALTESGTEPVSILTSSVYRELPLNKIAGEVLEKIKATQGAFNVGPGDPAEIVGQSVRQGKTGRPRLTRDDLAEVARIYIGGGTSPTKTVAKALDISRSAAAKRVARARKAGLLKTTDQGRASGPVATRIILTPGTPVRKKR